ncbi:putative ABC transporter ATP-binding protein [Fulvivirga imtechensis AK7]|uniref:Putative ABC transporter ATP-binding protein n=2 Tax=Fulvivirga TaxID=396811 RepID=L8JWL9_9BACT|nr:putative ABC transporter ATP-binding protein [Fulvivirga imtechensis AK7]
MPLGNIYGLLGKNGAGKTSLLKLISGLLFPNGGTLDVAGFQPKDRFPQYLREIYLVSEEFHLPSMYLERYVQLYSPFYPRFDYALLQEYLHEFNITGGQKLSEMSYGQKKKFLLSFGLATDCKLLILDEPTNGLDIPSKSQFRKVVANAIHEERSFIISTHQARDMENLIDPVIILDEGEIVFFQNYVQISKKLRVSKQKELPDNDALVYSESSLGGYTVVSENTTREETNMNLEILFNAVVSNKRKIYEIFKSE